MIKTWKNVKRQDKKTERQRVQTVQDAIPIQSAYEDGIFLIQAGKENKYSKSFLLADINYMTASQSVQKQIFLDWSELLNVLDPGSTNKLSVVKSRINKHTFDKFLLTCTDEKLKIYTNEYNKMLMDKSVNSNGMVQELYLTVSICKKDISAARNYFARTYSTLQAQATKLGSYCEVLSTNKRLNILHDIYRIGEENDYQFDMRESMAKGHDFKDYIAPDSMEIKDTYFKCGAKFGRALYLRDYATYLKDSFVSEICDLNRNLIWSMDIIPIPTDEAVKEAENRASSVDGNITKWFRKQTEQKNFTAVLPYDMEQQRSESKEFLTDLTTRNQRMLYAVMTMVHFADTKEQLDTDTEEIQATARKNLCRLSVLRWQQLDGLNTALPIGVRKIDSIRTLTTESNAIFMPFRSNEIQHEQGQYYGQNAVSKNLLMINPKKLQNGNCMILGVPGSGKSFCVKRVTISKAIATGNDIIIIDPEREYTPLIKAFSGEIIQISSTSDNHVNAMEINKEYGEGTDPIILKSEYMLSLCEQLVGHHNVGPKQKSLVDRCTDMCLREYVKNNYKGKAPTLIDFRNILLKQPEEEAQELALALELFTQGSLNTFAKPSNVNVHSRILCYDILDLGEQLKSIGMLVLLDNILNRITQNRANGIATSVIIDEFYLMFLHEYSADFFYRMWKRCRKYDADFTGITQNVEDLLASALARTMLANSEFVIMLNQAPTDSEQLARLLKISDMELEYVTNANEGCGLIKVGKSIIPFEDKFPEDTELYKLMNTKPGNVKQS